MKIFIYPTYNPKTDLNIYLKKFHSAFIGDSNFILVNRCSRLRAMNILFNVDAKVFVFNWPENVSLRKFGLFQMFILCLSIKVLKTLNKKIVWILHNKHAHTGKTRWVKWCMNFMSNNAKVVISHSKEGLSYFNETYKQSKAKCIYIPHPVYSSMIIANDNCKWDYILWGGIEPRKNILEFVRFAHGDSFFQGKKILICGKSSDVDYLNMVEAESLDNITIIPHKLSDAELGELISQSRVILFTYNSDSVLSSGALIYSLNYLKPIIGPHVGSFVDLQDIGIVECFESFEDIKYLSHKENSQQCIKYINDNTWEQFPHKLLSVL